MLEGREWLTPILSRLANKWVDNDTFPHNDLEVVLKKKNQVRSNMWREHRKTLQPPSAIWHHSLNVSTMVRDSFSWILLLISIVSHFHEWKVIGFNFLLSLVCDKILPIARSNAWTSMIKGIGLVNMHQNESTCTLWF